MHQDCLQWKPYSQFRKHAGYADGYKSWCNECGRLYSKEYYHRNKALNPRYARCKWTPQYPHSKWTRLRVAVDAPIRDYKPHRQWSNIKPKKLSFRFLMARNIAYTRRELKRLKGSDPVPTTNMFTIQEFVRLGLIRRNAFLARDTFLEHRIRTTYVQTVEEEFVHQDEYCYGEPPSSFRDFIKDAGEVKYLMTLDEDGNYLHEQVVVEEDLSEMRFLPKSRPELLRVA